MNTQLYVVYIALNTFNCIECIERTSVRINTSYGEIIVQGLYNKRAIIYEFRFHKNIIYDKFPCGKSCFLLGDNNHYSVIYSSHRFKKHNLPQIIHQNGVCSIKLE